MKASDNPFSSLLLVEGGTPASPSAGNQRLFVDSADHKVKRVNSAGIVTTVEAGGSLTSSTALLGADVTMTSANIYYDGPTLTLAAGTYILTSGLTIGTGSIAVNITYKLWDGTTALVSGQDTFPASYFDQCTLSWIVTPGSSTTYKMSTAVGQTGCLIKAAAPTNGAGNNASWIYAVKIA